MPPPKESVPFGFCTDPIDVSGADLGFLERGFICINGGERGSLADFISFFLNIPLRPNYFIFIGYFKWGTGRGLKQPPDPRLDPSLR